MDLPPLHTMPKLPSEDLSTIMVFHIALNLDSILKSRDIILLIKVHLLNAVVFPVVMYGCESWTIKKAEC